MIPSAGVRLGQWLARVGSWTIRGADRESELRHVLADERDVRLREAVEQRGRRLVGGDVHLDLADDRARVGSRIDDLEERHTGASEPGEDRPRDRGAPPVPREQGRVHPEHALACERDERIADQLRPADDEDQLGLELGDRRESGFGVDVACLVEHRTERRGDVVERALPRSTRVDRAGKGHDADDLRSRLGSRLQAVAADRVEADPDRAHRGAMLSS